jgi:hypothetical protein
MLAVFWRVGFWVALIYRLTLFDLSQRGRAVRAKGTVSSDRGHVSLVRVEEQLGVLFFGAGRAS